MSGIETKERIFKAAVELFARRGYAAVGVRELATAAEVNLSMISYYYGGKVGLLEEIVTCFFDRYRAIVEKHMGLSINLEKKIRGVVREIVGELKVNRDLWKVGLLELPYDVPQITKLKAEKVQGLRETFRSSFIANRFLPPEMEKRLEILGPAFISMMFSTFLLEPVVDEAFGVEHDDDFYERYIDTLSTLFLKGISGFVNPKKIFSIARSK